MKKLQKIEEVKILAEEISGNSTVVLVDYAGMGVKLQQDLRSELKKVGAKMKVVKNSLFKRAGKGADLPKDTFSDTVPVGPTAMIISKEDPIAPLQVLAKFAKETSLPEFKVGVVEGVFQDKENLTKLSKLPGKEVLLGQVVSSVGAPLYGIVGVLEANMQKLIFILKEASVNKT